MTLQIIPEKEKTEILEKLNQQFGIKKIPGLIARIGKERIFIYTGNLNKTQILNFEKNRIQIERLGVYFAKIQNDEIRLSFEGVQIFKNQIQKNYFEMDKKQMENWMHGQELNIKSGLKGFVTMKYKNDFLGCGKASENKITNFVPKSRRLKFKNQF